MITFEEIDVDEAISYIFTTSDFPILKNHIEDEKPQAGINKSSGNIHFESNDLLDEYKK